MRISKQKPIKKETFRIFFRLKSGVKHEILFFVFWCVYSLYIECYRDSVNIPYVILNKKYVSTWYAITKFIN